MNKSYSRHFKGDRKSELRSRIAEKKALARNPDLLQGSELVLRMKREDIDQFVTRIRRK